MKHLTKLSLLTTGALLAAPPTLRAADALGSPETWHARTIGAALLLTALFSLAGVVLAVAGYKLFDWLTPGHLHKEIVDNKNVAAAIVGAAVILGVCIIIAAAMLG